MAMNLKSLIVREGNDPLSGAFWQLYDSDTRRVLARFDSEFEAETELDRLKLRREEEERAPVSTKNDDLLGGYRAENREGSRSAPRRNLHEEWARKFGADFDRIKRETKEKAKAARSSANDDLFIDDDDLADYSSERRRR